MLGKLLKNDLKRNMRWMWILFVGTIVIAGIARGCGELGKTLTFFKIIGILIDTIFYSLLANSIIQPFLRSFLNFTKSLYGDESYLTHTLPVTKNQILNSKYLTAIIEISLGFICVIASVLIKFASAEMFLGLEQILSSVIEGSFSTFLVIMLIAILVIAEFLMFISIIFFSIIMGYKSNNKKVLSSFLFTGIMYFVSFIVLSVIMVIALLICGANLLNSTNIPNFAMYTIILTSTVVYLLFAVLFYLLAKKQFNKGVNVD